jgi:hypothetical protein
VTKGAAAACSSCHANRPVEYVTVRVYRKRSQVEFRYRVCKECILVLATFLEGSAIAVQRGLFSQKEEDAFQDTRLRSSHGTTGRRSQGAD